MSTPHTFSPMRFAAETAVARSAGSDLGEFGAAAAVEVRAEIVRRAGSLHRRDDLAADHQRADIGAARFLDEFLHQDVDVGPAEGLDHRLGRGHGLGENDADALRALEQLDDHGRPLTALMISSACLGSLA